MGRVTGKVALVSGAARGQGCSQARTLAAEGADIIALDICADAYTEIANAGICPMSAGLPPQAFVDAADAGGLLKIKPWSGP